MSSQRKETLALAMKLEATTKAALVPFDMLHQTSTRENVEVVLDWPRESRTQPNRERSGFIR